MSIALGDNEVVSVCGEASISYGVSELKKWKYKSEERVRLIGLNYFVQHSEKESPWYSM